MKNRILFIVNPISGIGKQKIIEQAVEKYIDKAVFDTHFAYTQYSGHAEDICHNAVNRYNIIVATGGDGTVNEVSRPLINSNSILAVIPTGSGNGFARFFKIPLKINEAIKLINKQNIINIDTALINDKSFVNVAGIGFDAHIAHLFDNFGKRGFFPYIWLVMKNFANYKSKTYEIKFDKNTVSENAFVISIANSSQFGFNAHIAPKAKTDDGILNITVLQRFPIWVAPALAARLFLKNIHKSKFVRTFTASKINIKTSTSETEAHIDGEAVVIDGDIRISVNPNSLRVIANI